MADESAVLLARMLQVDGLPGVLVSNRLWRELSVDALTHLVTTQTAIYVCDGQLVRIQRKEDGSPAIEIFTETTLKGLLGRRMNFVKVTERGATHCPPPDAMVKDILTLGSWPFPPLDGIIEVPVLRPDGTTLTTPGYDATTRLYYAPGASLKTPLIPEHPTAEDVIAALADIHKGDFKRRLGKALSYRVGTRFDDSGLHLVKGEPDKRSGAVYWSVAAPAREEPMIESHM